MVVVIESKNWNIIIIFIGGGIQCAHNADTFHEQILYFPNNAFKSTGIKFFIQWLRTYKLNSEKLLNCAVAHVEITNHRIKARGDITLRI